MNNRDSTHFLGDSTFFLGLAESMSFDVMGNPQEMRALQGIMLFFLSWGYSFSKFRGSTSNRPFVDGLYIQSGYQMGQYLLYQYNCIILYLHIHVGWIIADCSHSCFHFWIMISKAKHIVCFLLLRLLNGNCNRSLNI